VVEWEEEDHPGEIRIVVVILSEEDDEDHGDSTVPGSNWRPSRRFRSLYTKLSSGFPYSRVHQF
jgi:hypothetical protein